jgi:CspA family cold shock protein
MLIDRLKKMFFVKDKRKKTGFLKYYNRSRGYGFIRSKQTSKDVFAHVTDMEQRIKVGERVKFEVEFTQRGLQARNIEPVEA